MQLTLSGEQCGDDCKWSRLSDYSLSVDRFSTGTEFRRRHVIVVGDHCCLSGCAIFIGLLVLQCCWLIGHAILHGLMVPQN